MPAPDARLVADEVVVTGAGPLFVFDYLAVGRVVPDRVAAIVAGVAGGCRLARCALLGGETAEHPNTMAPDARATGYRDQPGHCAGRAAVAWGTT